MVARVSRTCSRSDCDAMADSFPELLLTPSKVVPVQNRARVVLDLPHCQPCAAKVGGDVEVLMTDEGWTVACNAVSAMSGGKAVPRRKLTMLCWLPLDSPEVPATFKAPR